MAVWDNANLPFQDGTEIHAQFFNSNGGREGPEFLVDDHAGHHGRARTTFGPSGTLTVVWRGAHPNAAESILARRFDSDGTPEGASFPVNTGPEDVWGPDISHSMDGTIVITWSTFDSSTNTAGVFARRYGPSGQPLGDQVRVDSGHESASWARVTHSPNGSFLVVWRTYDFDQGDNRSDVWARLFDSSGHAFGLEFIVNETELGEQDTPSVSAGDDGTFLVAWRDRQDPNLGGHSVRARRFIPIPKTVPVVGIPTLSRFGGAVLCADHPPLGVETIRYRSCNQ